MRPLPIKELPKPLPFKKLLGPSFIILGLGLGSGELILWPYMASNFGMGIIWGAVLGITFQFFMNLEIERYALAHGESIFVGFYRKCKHLPFWFIFSTFVPWVWPGIVASSSKILGFVLGISETKNLAIGFLILMGLILSLGPVLYKTVENLQKTVILTGVPAIFLLSIFLAKPTDWQALASGIVGIGDGYNFLPAGLPIASFLAALAYAGAGGNLNLAQAFYIKEKGYGMGAHAGKITSILTGKKSELTVTGNTFSPTKENFRVFDKWWKNINLEHFLIFWLTGAITIVLLALLSYATTYGLGVNKQGIDFILIEGKVIGEKLFPLVGTLFLVVAGIMLFCTQLTVLDATSRILTENILLLDKNEKKKNVSKFYYTILWVQILTGILIFLLGVTEPLQLLIIAAVLNAFAMFVHVGLTMWVNLTLLYKQIRPSFFRIVMMTLAFLFYGGFSLYVLIDAFI